MLATETAHIHLDERGVAWIDDTNTKVIEVVLDKLAHGSSPEEIHFQHPHLSLAQIYAAFTYYYDHQAEIDAEIERQVRRVEELRALAGFSLAKTDASTGETSVSVKLYMDVHVHDAITRGLRQRGVDVLTAQMERGGLLILTSSIEQLR